MTNVDLSDRLAACYTGVVHDVMRAMGLRDFTLPAELRPILPEQAMAGPAFTIEGRVDTNADDRDCKRGGNNEQLAHRCILLAAP